MSTEDELKRWLSRPEKSFNENLSFAIKVWRSNEFAFTNKYGVIFDWFGVNMKQLKKAGKSVDWVLIEDFLSLRCSPGLITVETKKSFIDLVVKSTLKRKDFDNRKFIEFLNDLIDHEIFQNFYKSDYEAYCQLLGTLFKCYEKYLHLQVKVLLAYEGAFFTKIMENLKDQVKKAGNIENLGDNFVQYTLQPIVEVTIILKNHNLNYFNDLYDIEKYLYNDYSNSAIFLQILEFPIHLNLLNFECSIVNFRGDISFYTKLLNMIFVFYKNSNEGLHPEMMLTITTYVLEMFRKHDIGLNFKIDETYSVIQYLGKQIEELVNEFYEHHFYDVLQLLCSTLRLNPLILENNIFNITTKLMLTKKMDSREQKKFEEFLVLLLDMFRKLSRAEKLVSILLKNVKEYLNEYGISKNMKRKLNSSEIDGNADKKLKTEENSLDIKNIIKSEEEPSENIYLNIILKDFNTVVISKSAQSIENFPLIDFAWPGNTVGYAFSKVILSLVSKPTLVIWKTIVFSLKDVIQSLKTSNIDENVLFLVDFHASLLCQFFSGCKLTEQADKFWDEIEKARKLTRDILTEFGQALLNYEHNNRTMNAFLECSYFVGFFDLILWYYRPDFMQNEKIFSDLSKNIHDFLTPEEWILIQQRIANFGKAECKINTNRLCFQRATARMLFQNKNTINIQKYLLSSTFNDYQQVKAIFFDSNNRWLLSHLKPAEKIKICELIVAEKDLQFIQSFSENLEFFETIILILYQNLAECFTNSKKSIISSINFENLHNRDQLDRNIKEIGMAINKKGNSYSIKKFSLENLKGFLDILVQLPIGYCRFKIKTVIFGLHFALYRDLIASNDEKYSSIVFDFFTDILHFGPKINICKYFAIEKLLSVIPSEKSTDFYNFIFSTIKLNVDDGETLLAKIVEILNENEENFSNNYVQLATIAIESLSHQTSNKKYKKYFDEILLIYSKKVKKFFANEDGRSPDDDKEFVKKTLPAYSIYINSVLSNVKQSEEFDANLRRISKIYIGYSMNCHNAHSIRLISVALTQQAALHFDSDEIDFVLQKYWEELNEDLKIGIFDQKNSDAVIKLIISHKTNENFLKFLKDIQKNIERHEFSYICRLFSHLSKYHFSSIKGAIFNEHFKQITFNMILRLEKDSQRQFTDYDTVLSIINSQKALCENDKIPLSIDTLDDILSFLIDVNLKKFQVDDTNMSIFYNLVRTIVDLCTAIIKNHHINLMDRVPQLVHIYQDLLQSICWYKSDRQNDIDLTTDELDELSALALKMERLMNLISVHNVEVKRVAPYLLTFTINLMVSNQRPTTLYPKIKTHIENICYDLVSVCDHRVGNFILRCSNEAGKQVYEVLCKEYKKYHKFKGKV